MPYVLVLHRYLPKFFIIGGLLLFSGCGPDFIYDTRQELPETGWAYSKPVSFPFEVQDTNTVYNLWLDVGHTTAYKNQNLYTKIHTTFPDGQQISEVVSLELADKAGEWFGNCSGQSCVLRVPLQMDTYFNQSGKYIIGIEQYMRQDSLAEVQSMRLLIEDTGKER
jgi:gliding motility-associated lipoprotein GldH